MRKFLQRLLGNFVIRMANKYGSSPNRERVHTALTKLYEDIVDNPGKKGLLLSIKPGDRYIIFSDQHKGARDFSDDFTLAENNYLTALNHYNSENFSLICLGDSEELWENTLESVKKHNQKVFELERNFLQRNAFIKIFGNHDLYWDNDPLAGFQLEKIYGQKVKIYEGLILQDESFNPTVQFFLTHGHQGDLQSDGNWFSKWFVSTIWAPFQSYLRINPNTPAFNNQLKTMHNLLMYEWAATQKSVLITGHTHQPVFNSLTHLERIYQKLDVARKQKALLEEKKLLLQMEKEHIAGAANQIFKPLKPNYFNSGCCCFSDGDITGLEIANGKISLIKWAYQADQSSKKIVLEETDITNLIT